MLKPLPALGLFTITCLVPALSAASPAPAPQIEHVYITQAGQYIVNFANPDKPSVDATAAAATAPAAARVRFLPEGNAIHLQDSPRFGVRYSLVGSPDGAPVDIRCVTIYPGSGAKKPGATAPVLREESTWPRAIGSANYCGYAINDNWQRIPGNWTVEIWHGNEKLASQTFTLVP